MAHIARNLKLQLNFEREELPPSRQFVRTKIVCTIGPKTSSPDVLGQMMDAGMNVARLNFSHGSHEYHGNVIDNIREALRRDPRRRCAIMLDTKGPEIRTGKLRDKKCELVAGQTIKVSADNTILGDSTMISLDYPKLCHSVKPGYQILIADGLISLTVQSVHEKDGYVTCRVNNSAILGETKNVHLPGAIVELPAVSEKDISDLRFGVSKGVDMVAASFVRKPEDVQEIREILGEEGKDIMIISKIESIEGVQNFDAVLAESDGIMVARGDLGVELPMQEIFIAQKMMISKCNAASKPVITATQMLESMIENPRPTRAECTDVANAVLDGTDCVMLSGETANGDYPLQAIKIMKKICFEAELVDSFAHYPTVFAALMKTSGAMATDGELGSAYAVRTANDLAADLIMTVTDTGRTARYLAKYRPKVPVLVITSNEKTAAHLLTTKAALPFLLPKVNELPTNEVVSAGFQYAMSLKFVKPGSLVVFVTGTEGKHTLTVKVLSVPEKTQ